MKPDIAHKKDIKFIISRFYDTLLADEKMMPFFKDIIAQNELEHHLDVITDFWNDILFDTNTYQANVMQKHLDKHAFIPFTKAHFNSWVSYFFETIDAYFEGATSELMKARAQSIAAVMQLKMQVYNTEK
jgi:hemoglobin